MRPPDIAAHLTATHPLRFSTSALGSVLENVRSESDWPTVGDEAIFTAGSARTLRVLASKLQRFNRGLSLGVTPLHVDLDLVVGAEWPDREDVHAAHSLQVE